MLTYPDVALFTAEAFEQMVLGEERSELVEGEVVAMSPAGFEHGIVANEFARQLSNFVREHRLGFVPTAETGFVLARNPDTVRAPDTAFVTSARVASQKRLTGFFEGAPDLAVEVVSPFDRDEEVDQRVQDFLRAGTRMVVVIRPRTRTLAVYRSPTTVQILTPEDTWDGSDILPGLAIPVASLFDF